ncbi:ABC transporter G family protein [Tieghemostelium lacteum]|uniref:ABC transporter G family protein n=1 Tax=Tieghemostelium lacteum TaxID=361077 RepID=A0A151Z9Q2_TIELA|nr:ABC transporter G family protein [Tieghemostelium lacteum]|eukprot:KYQ90665.1 ABC transporter G family protein [Tieghemostelium lacteum]
MKIINITILYLLIFLLVNINSRLDCKSIAEKEEHYTFEGKSGQQILHENFNTELLREQQEESIRLSREVILEFKDVSPYYSRMYENLKLLENSQSASSNSVDSNTTTTTTSTNSTTTTTSGTSTTGGNSTTTSSGASTTSTTGNSTTTSSGTSTTGGNSTTGSSGTSTTGDSSTTSGNTTSSSSGGSSSEVPIESSDGSRAVSWYGEACEDTTFGFLNETGPCGVANCYEEWGQGFCNTTTGECKCTYFFTGSDCSIDIDPDHQWDAINCHGSRSCPPVYNNPLPHQCICKPGWSGVECSVCNANPVCNSIATNSSQEDYLNICDTTAYLYKSKQYSCVITGQQVISSMNSVGGVALECDFPDADYVSGLYSTCSMNLYYHTTGPPLYFNCSFDGCVRNILPGQSQEIICQNSACSCTTFCSGILNSIISQVNGTANFTCDSNLNCQFSQEVIAAMYPTIPMSCVAGECTLQPPPILPVPVQNVDRILVYISTGVSTIVIAMITGLVFFVSEKQEQRKHIPPPNHVPCDLRFSDISCTVQEKWSFNKTKPKQILDNVHGICQSGHLTALMGLSGSGKTSLLDILSGRKNVGDISGNILINGLPVPENFKRISGYVTQEDIMIGTLTCREHLMYAAMLKLPESIPMHEKERRVDDALRALNISKIANSRIGTAEKRGISGGEKKRLAIAAELIIDPSILFLDEPTSGLDSHSAYDLIKLLKKIAVDGDRTIILSIHQPSAEIFEKLDNLVLLHQGQLHYSGKAQQSIEYFDQKLRTNFPNQRELSRENHRNPADFIISVISNDQFKLPIFESQHQIQYSYQKEVQVIDVDIDENRNIPSSSIHLRQQQNNIYLHKVDEYATSFWTQFMVVGRRSMLNYLRNPFLLRTTYFVHILVGFILGWLFWKLPANLEPGCQNRFGSMFFIIALLSFGSITSLDLFYHDRIIFIRERSNGYYRTSSYFLSKAITDILPMRVLPPLLLGGICYYMIGFRPGFLHFLYFLISLVLTSTTAATMCMAISTISPTFGTANMISILLLFVFLLFDGFLLARQSIPIYLKWLVMLSFMSYGLEIPVVNEFNGLWVFYNPPNTRGTYADGLEFLQSIGADPNRLFIDMYVLVGMIIGYLLLAYVFLRFLVKEYR